MTVKPQKQALTLAEKNKIFLINAHEILNIIPFRARAVPP